MHEGVEGGVGVWYESGWEWAHVSVGGEALSRWVGKLKKNEYEDVGINPEPCREVAPSYHHYVLGTAILEDPSLGTTNWLAGGIHDKVASPVALYKLIFVCSESVRTANEILGSFGKQKKVKSEVLQGKRRLRILIPIIPSGVIEIKNSM